MACGDVIKVWKPNPTDDLALKPCPFCGNKDVLYIQYEHASGPRWKVECGECTACIDPGYAQKRVRVMDLWNRRKES